MSNCPSCGHSLGIILAEDAKVGALYHHRKCRAVLVLIAADSPPQLEFRIATEAEKAAWQGVPT